MNHPVDGADAEEAQWMAEFVRTRDRVLFERLFDRYRRRMVTYAQKYVQRKDRAEELAQDVFIRVYTCKRYRPDAPFRAWIYQVATRVCLNEVRKREYAVNHAEQAPEPAVATSPEDALEGARLSARLQARLQRLPDKQRAAFVMCRFEGLSHDEIAQALQVSVSSTKSLIHRALEALRAEVRSHQEMTCTSPMNS